MSADQTRPTDDQSGSRAPVQGVTAAVQRAAEVIDDWTGVGHASVAIAEAVLAAALDVEEIARAVYGDDFARGYCTAVWEALDEDGREGYREYARAVVAHLLGGEVR